MGAMPPIYLGSLSWLKLDIQIFLYFLAVDELLRSYNVLPYLHQYNVVQAFFMVLKRCLFQRIETKYRLM